MSVNDDILAQIVVFMLDGIELLTAFVSKESLRVSKELAYDFIVCYY